MLLIIIYLSFKILIEKSESGNTQNPSSPSDVCFLGVTLFRMERITNLEFGLSAPLVLKHLTNCLLSSDLCLKPFNMPKRLSAYQGVVLVKLVDKGSLVNCGDVVHR